MVDLHDRENRWSCELAFPMIVRGHLTGFVLLGARTGGERFRPDQISLLSAAVQQFGLDVESLRVESMGRRMTVSESMASSLKAEVETLRLHVQDLRANNESLLTTSNSLRAIVDGKAFMRGT